MCKALGSIPGTVEKERKTKQKTSQYADRV
jgi:hypothetical protein